MENWKNVVQRKRAEIAQKIEPYALPEQHLAQPEVKDVSNFLNLGILSPEEWEMTNPASVDLLLGKLHDGSWSAVDVVRAHIKSATVIHQLCTVLTEPNFSAALSRAAELDAHLATHGTPIGPLHGLPVTAKDQFNVIGLDSTITYTALGFQPVVHKDDQSGIITALDSLGAIIIAKTTLPQSILWCETESPLFGLTTNPNNRDFTPGGSSGGEAVVLAMRGSALGWGTDIGGSIRIPCSMMGLAGFKPSNARLPYSKTTVSLAGQEHIPSSIGPMARSTSDLVTAMKALLAQDLSRIDPRTVPITWRDSVYTSTLTRKLRIGVIWDDGTVRVHPPIARLLRETVAKLRAAGHEIVDWSPPNLHQEAIAVMDDFYRADAGEDVRRAVTAGGEPFLPVVQRLVDRGPAISVYEYWALNRRKWDVQERYCQFWNEQGVDLLLSPAMGHGAVPHRTCEWVGYTKVWNVLDYPAGVVRVGTIGKEEDAAMEEWRAYTPRNPLDERNWKLFDPESMLGHPVGLQIVGRRFEEETTLAGMKIVEDMMRGGWDK